MRLPHCADREEAATRAGTRGDSGLGSVSNAITSLLSYGLGRDRLGTRDPEYWAL